jgi:hypothetical protein
VLSASLLEAARVKPRLFPGALLLVAACGSAPPVVVAPGSPAPHVTADIGAGCPATATVLASLTGTMTIDAYVTRGTPALDAFASQLADTLTRYKGVSNGHLEVRVMDATVPEHKAAAKGFGLVEQRLDDAGPAVTGYMGLAFRYGSVSDVIPMLSLDSKDELDFWITMKLREVRDQADHKKRRIGVLTGHGELLLDGDNLVPRQANKKGPSLRDIIVQNFAFFDLVNVDLGKGDAAIDPTLDGLVVTQPKGDLTDKELRRIDELVMRGKALAVFASSVNVAPGDARMKATLSAHGLERLLEGYGIELRKDVVLDVKNAYSITVPTPSGDVKAPFPQFVSVTDDTRLTGDHRLLDTASPLFFRLDELMFPFVSSLVLHKDRQPGAQTLKVLARSSPLSFRETTDSVDLAPFQRWKAHAGGEEQYAIAATVAGRLTSAFAPGDPVVPPRSLASARVFVLASSQFLANPFALAGQGPEGQDKELLQLAQHYMTKNVLTAMILQLKDTLDWISARDDLTMCAPKE